MAKISINKDKCKGCFLCVSFCPKALLKQGVNLNSKGFQYVDFTQTGECSGCSMCATICPDCCIEVYR